MSATVGEGLLRWVEVDTDQLSANAASIAALVRPAAFMAMVKSNGYGHGLVIAARAAVDGGATWLGVYTPQEAFALRSAGLEVPILVAGWSPPSSYAELIARRLDVSVFDAHAVRALAATAAAPGVRTRVQVKVDTGLHRLGVLPAEIAALAAALRSAEARVEVTGIFTHFADPAGDPVFTRKQHARFLDAVEELRQVAPGALLHTSGSASVGAHPSMHHDLVRVGIAFYGYPPVSLQASLRPAMNVFGRVAQLRTVPDGESVGYGRTWRAGGSSRIATVTIGYGQGLPRSLANRGQVAIRGVRCPIVGMVSMDQVTVDVTNADAVKVDDAAMFIGERQGVRLGADEVAALTGTLSYEVLCGIAAWIPRLPGSTPAALP